MALSWDITKVKDCDKTCFILDDVGGREEMKALTHTLIMMSMPIGLRGITEKNWQMWYVRLDILQRMNGALMREGSEDYFITPKDVRAHIGLTVNVADETQAKWLARIGKSHMQSLAFNANRRLAEAGAFNK